MAKTKIELQAATELAATGTLTQAPEFAQRVGGARSGVAFVNIYNVATAGVYTFAIDHASSLQMNSGPTRTNWVQNNSGSTTSLAAGAATSIAISLTTLGDVIRWRCTAIPGTVTFSITVFLWDT